MTANDPGPAPAITVVMALTNHRGWTVAALLAWNAQTCPRDRIALSLLHDGGAAAFEHLLRPHLQPQDRLRTAPGLGEIALYDLGVRDARTDWVFITEPHVEPDPSAVAEMLEYLRESGLPGAACFSEGCRGNNFVGRMEDAVFARDLASKGGASHWNKIILRGCCLRRSVYIECGGLESRFGHFGEPLLGARLAEKGYRLGLARRAVCRHHSTVRFATLVGELRRYGADELRCCLDLDRDFESKYFDVSGSVNLLSGLPLPVALGLFRRLWDTRREQHAGVVPPVLLVRQLARSPRFSRWWRRALIGGLVGVIHACRWQPASAASLTHALWRMSIRLGREEELLERGSAPRPPAASGALGAGSLSPYNSIGFYGVERRGDTAFRWTCGAAAVLLPLTPGRYRIAVEFLNLRRLRDDEWIVLELAGYRGRYALSDGESRVELEVAVVPEPDRPLPLYIVGTTLGPGAGNPRERRTLGIACAAIEWRRLEPGPTRPDRSPWSRIAGNRRTKP